MGQVKMAEVRAWWRDAAANYTHYYLLAGVGLFIVVALLPHFMGLFEGCAKYVDHDLPIVPFALAVVIGVQNVLFVYAPIADSRMGPRTSNIFRKLICIGLPSTLLFLAVYQQFSLYFPAIVQFPEVLCD